MCTNKDYLLIFRHIICQKVTQPSSVLAAVNAFCHVCLEGTFVNDDSRTCLVQLCRYFTVGGHISHSTVITHKCPFRPVPWRIGIPSYTWFLGHMSLTPKRHLNRFSHLFTGQPCQHIDRQTYRPRYARHL